jgi:hypothetical protein
MARRTKYHVDTMTRLMDSHKQFMGGLKTVDTDDSLKGFFLRDVENISLSEFGFLERRYGLVNDANFEFVVPQVVDEVIDPFTGDRSFKDRLQGYFEYVRPDKVVETIIFYNGKLYLNKAQVTKLYQYPQSFDPKLGLYNNNISATDFKEYLIKVHNYDKFDTFDLIDDLFNTGREVEGVRIENRMFFFTGVYPIVYEGTGEFYILPEFVTNFQQLALFSHNLHTSNLDRTYTEGFPASDISDIDVADLSLPYVGDFGYYPMFPYMVGDGRGLTFRVNFKVPNEAPFNAPNFTGFLTTEDGKRDQTNAGATYVELIPEVYYRPAGLAVPAEDQREGVDRTWTRVDSNNVEFYTRGTNGNLTRRFAFSNLPTGQNANTFRLLNENPDRGEDEKYVFPSFFEQDRLYSNPTTRRNHAPVFVNPETATPAQLNRNIEIKILNLPSGLHDIRIEFRVYTANYEKTVAGSEQSTVYKEKLAFRRTEIFPSITITAERTTDYLQFLRLPDRVNEEGQEETDRVEEIPVNDPAALWTCNKVLNHYGKLMAYGSTIYPDRLFIGHPTFIHYFPFFFTRDFQSDDQKPILQITPFMNILVVQNETYSWGLKGIDAVLGAENFYTPFVISPIYGTIAPKSVRPIRNQLFFLSADGIVSLQSLYAIDDQYNVKHMDKNIQNIVPADPDAVAIQYDDQYWIHFPNTPTGITLRYHVDLRAWMKDTYFEYNGVDNNGKPQKSETIFNGVHKYIRKDDGLILITNPMKFADKVSITEEATNYRILKLHVDYSMATDIGETPRTLFETSYLDQDHPFNEKRYMEQKMDFTIQNEYHLGKEPLFRDESMAMEGNLPAGVNQYTMYRLPLVKNHEYDVIVPQQGTDPYVNNRANIKRINVRLFDIKQNLLRTLSFQAEKPPKPSILDLQLFPEAQEIKFKVYNNDLVTNNLRWVLRSTDPDDLRVIAQGTRFSVASNQSSEVLVENVRYGPLKLEVSATRVGVDPPVFSETRIREFQLEDGLFDIFTTDPRQASLGPLAVTAIPKGANNVANSIELTWIDQNPSPGSTNFRVNVRNITVGGESGPILATSLDPATTYTLNFTSQQATDLQGNVFEFEVFSLIESRISLPVTIRVTLELFDQVPENVGPLTVSLENQFPSRLRFSWTDIASEAAYEVAWRYLSEPAYASFEAFPTNRRVTLEQNTTFYQFTVDKPNFQNLPEISTNAIVEFNIRGRNANGVSETNQTRQGIYRAIYDPTKFVTAKIDGSSGIRITIPEAKKSLTHGTPNYVFETAWGVEFRKKGTTLFSTEKIVATNNTSNVIELTGADGLEENTVYEIRVRGRYTVNGATTFLPFQAGMLFEAESGVAQFQPLANPEFVGSQNIDQDPDLKLSFTVRNKATESAVIHYLINNSSTVADVPTTAFSTATLAPNGTQSFSNISVGSGQTIYIHLKAYPLSGVNALPSSVVSSAPILTPAFVTASFNTDGGSPSSYLPQSGYAPFQATSPGLPTRNGVQATGWSPNIATPINTNTTFVAVYPAPPPQTITASFDTNGGNETYGSISTTSSSLFVASPGSPTRSGFVFSGWSPSLPTTIFSSTQFVAQWTADGSTLPAAPSSVSISSPADNQVTFSWPSVSGATSYAWELYLDGALADSSTTTSLTVTRTISAGQVQARVRACNANGCGAQRNSATITVSGFAFG